MTRLYQIHNEVRQRAEQIAAAHGNWPCRKGCAGCCRQLATVPRIAQAEWRLIAAAIDEPLRQRIRDSTGATRPVVCPLLDALSGACLIYEVRPVACRAYGFYAERDLVLGCSRIESISRESPDVIWGNHTALEDRVDGLGPAEELFVWLDGGSEIELQAELDVARQTVVVEVAEAGI